MNEAGGSCRYIHTSPTHTSPTRATRKTAVCENLVVDGDQREKIRPVLRLDWRVMDVPCFHHTVFFVQPCGYFLRSIHRVKNLPSSRTIPTRRSGVIKRFYYTMKRIILTRKNCSCAPTRTSTRTRSRTGTENKNRTVESKSNSIRSPSKSPHWPPVVVAAQAPTPQPAAARLNRAGFMHGDDK